MTRSVTVDTLHAPYEKMQDFCMFTVRCLLQSGVFGELGTATGKVSIAMMALANELDVVQSTLAQTTQRIQITAIQSFH